MQLSDIQGSVSIANISTKDLPPPISANVIVEKFNKIDDVLSNIGSTLSAGTDREFYRDSYNPIANSPVAIALDGKLDKEYDETDILGEFHSMCANENGSIIVFGGDEAGDTIVRDGAIFYSLDCLKTIMRTSVSVKNAKEAIPDCLSVSAKLTLPQGDFSADQPLTTYPQWRALCYSKKSHTFLATPMAVSYVDKNNTLKRADLVWTSKNGVDWNCIVLSTYVDASDNQYITKIGYDDDTGITVVPRGNRLFWSEDCVNWNVYMITGYEGTYTYNNLSYSYKFNGTSIDSLGNGKFLVWSGAHYSATNLDNSVTIATYDSETKSFSNGDVHKSSDFGNKTYCFIPCSSVANGAAIANMFGISNGYVNLLKYDIDSGALEGFRSYDTNWTNQTRSTFAYGNDIYVMTRTPRGMMKIEVTRDSDSNKSFNVTQVFTGRSDKFEAACVVNGKFYIAGRTSYGFVYEYDPSSSALTKVNYGIRKLVKYVKTSEMSSYAKTSDLATYAKTSDLSSYAKSSEVSSCVKKTNIDTLSAMDAGTGQSLDLDSVIETVNKIIAAFNKLKN